MTRTVFLRALEADDKEVALLAAITNPDETRARQRFETDPADFSKVPRSPFAYWVTERLRDLFTTVPAFESDGRTAKQGLATADDFRFVRLWWETAPSQQGRKWFLFAKGGKFSPYYADVYLTVNWRDDGAEIWAFERAVVRNQEFFFRPGLTWPRRTQGGLSLRTMPAACVFADKGPAIFTTDDSSDSLLALLAITNSRPFKAAVDMQMAFGSYEVGVLQRTPIPKLPRSEESRLALFARRAWSLKRSFDTIVENSHAFSLPALLQVKSDDIALRYAEAAERLRASEEALSSLQFEIDHRCFELYGIDDEDRRAITEGFGSSKDEASDDDEIDEDADEDEVSVDARNLAAALVSWCVGVALSRFDVRLATGERSLPGEPEPFDPLPICSSGMLTGDDGMPLATPLPGYPIDWPFDGLLVDAPGHPRDVETRVRQVLGVVYPDRADDIERELCAILGVKSLREWLRKPANFFADHLARYSKSRRQAPIYWPLSTESGGYTIWLYIHRLTDQTLFLAVNELVEPKLRDTEGSLQRLRAKSSRARAEERELEELQGLESELAVLRAELLRVAAFWKPNLDDGVLITASPLWKLFRLGKWQKTLKETWQKLERGDYHWAHLAYTIWPDRVREKCKSDKSLAIAHGLEELYAEPPKSKKRKKRSADDDSDEFELA